MKKLSKVDWSKKSAQKTASPEKGMKKLEPAQMGTVNGGGRFTN